MQMQTKKATIIAFEGIDQSGKETQARKLAQRLEQEGKKVYLGGFPAYDTPIGTEIHKFLQGERSFNPYTRQMLYVANRYEMLEQLQQAMEEMDYIILDRYKGSGYAYGMITGLDLRWCIEIEKYLPDPDYCLLFDTSSEQSFERKQMGRDVYEQQLDFLESVRQAYLQLADQFGWKVLKSNKSQEELADEVWKFIEGK